MADGYVTRSFALRCLGLTILPSERARLDRIKDLKQRLEGAKHDLEVAQRQGKYELASRLRFSTIPEL